MSFDGKTVGLGVLSWRGAASLKQALQSYADADMFSLFDDTIVFLPDPDEAVKSVVAQFDIRAEESPDNYGILAGMEEIAKRLKTDYVLFTENDCPLLESREEAQRQIEKALTLLKDDTVIMARMRHTKDFGETFDTIDKYRRYHPDTPNFGASVRKLLRPGKARRLSGTSLYAGAGHPERFPRDIENAGDGFYLVSARVLPWTNQSILMRRDRFLDTIIPYCKSVPLDRGINGFRSVEIELNRSKFWTRSGWRIACGPGLFTHRRANDRGY